MKKIILIIALTILANTLMAQKQSGQYFIKKIDGCDSVFIDGKFYKEGDYVKTFKGVTWFSHCKSVVTISCEKDGKKEKIMFHDSRPVQPSPPRGHSQNGGELRSRGLMDVIQVIDYENAVELPWIPEEGCEYSASLGFQSHPVFLENGKLWLTPETFKNDRKPDGADQEETIFVDKIKDGITIETIELKVILDF